MFLDCLTQHRKRLSFAKEEIALFYTTLRMSIVLWLFCKNVWGIKFTIIYFVFSVIIICGGQYLVGCILNKTHIINYDEEWNSARIPMIKEIANNVNGG